ncbi:hypothetical protein SAMN05661080_02991 [Modestobacter sp. DSM 44400]|uniref:DUF6518 family protein n=1 Tax=Modestobacter sp. DSM 44400 TaxID=1550230 RepID=UPI00089BE7CD|nr:DUF6518 family protein [Modestobacter sp. DSM 44400]SDY29848.1 hypothetical protein SAMN05661080_02991 [Modestobacter sp. DSM 44400]
MDVQQPVHRGAWVTRVGSPAGLAAALAGGLATGSFGAWAYHDDLLRPLAHRFGLWVLLVALLSARQPARTAIARSVLGLATAVLAFYVGKQVMYGIDYPGMPYALNFSVIAEWLVLAAVAGSLLGWAFHSIGRDGRRGAPATAAAVGLLVADAFRRSTNYATDGRVLVPFAALAVVLVLAVGVRSLRQLAGTAVWALPIPPWVCCSSPDPISSSSC